MAILVVALLTLLPLVLLVVDLLRPHREPDSYAGPARRQVAVPAVETSTVHAPSVVARPAAGAPVAPAAPRLARPIAGSPGGARRDFFGDGLGRTA